MRTNRFDHALGRQITFFLRGLMLGVLFSAKDSAHGDLGVIRDTYQIDHNKPHSMLLSLSIFNEILYQEMKKTSSPRIVILKIMECCQFIGSATREQSR